MLLLVCVPQLSLMIFFVAFDGRYLSNSRLGEVSEVNVKFVAIWLKHWKQNIGQNG